MNRVVSPTADGGYLLRPGRHYRLLVVVNTSGSRRPTDLEFERTLADEGFQDVATALPSDWTPELVAELEWPEEPALTPAANEILVRVKGAFFADVPTRFDRDLPIDPSDGTYSIVACWECGAATRAPGSERTAGAAPEEKKEGGSSKLVAIGVVGALVGGGWLLSRRGQREQAQEEALLRLEQKAQRTELEDRVAAYLATGASREDAERRAERDVATVAARQFADELAAGGELA